MAQAPAFSDADLQRLADQLSALQSSLALLRERLESGDPETAEQALAKLNGQLLGTRSQWRQMLDLPAPR